MSRVRIWLSILGAAFIGAALALLAAATSWLRKSSGERALQASKDKVEADVAAAVEAVKLNRAHVVEQAAAIDEAAEKEKARDAVDVANDILADLGGGAGEPPKSGG